MRRKLESQNLLVAIGLATAVVATTALAIASPGTGGIAGAAQAAAGVALVFFLPGYALTRAIFPPATARSITGPDRLAWTIGLSIGLAVLGALALNLLPGGLSRTSWLVLLGGTTIVGAVAVAVAPAASGKPAVSGWSYRIGPAALRLAAKRATMVAAPALVALLALNLAWSSESRVPREGFAQLWLVPQSATRTDPTSTEAALGIQSYLDGDRRYRLELRRDGAIVQDWLVILSSGETWQQRVELRAGQLIEADLYREGDQAPYRRVSLAR